jgi:methionyl aminopeptidase
MATVKRTISLSLPNGRCMSIATEEELACMRTAGIVARLVLEAMKRAVRPGVTIAELDAIGNKVMRQNGAQFHY